MTGQLFFVILSSMLPVGHSLTIHLTGRHPHTALRDGQTVHIEVLGKGIGGLQLLRIAGRIYTAQGDARLVEGRVLDGRVYAGKGYVRLELTPSPPVREQHQPAGLQNTFTAELLSWSTELATLTRRELTPERLARWRSLALRSPDRFRSALIADCIREDHELDEESPHLYRLIDCIDRRPDEQRADSDSNWLALFNQRRSGSLQWLIFPFSNQASQGSCRGSVLILVDPAAPEPKKTFIFAHVQNVQWFFSLDNDIVEYDTTPKASCNEVSNLHEALCRHLESTGLHLLCRQKTGSIRSVDLEA